MRFELPQQKRLVFEMEMPVRWGDMDAMGHVNNTGYFRYLETTRIEWMRSLGLVLGPQGEGIVIINAFCTFHQQLEYPCDILVKMYASDPGRSSFETWGTIERTDRPGVICASGGATTVWVDFPKQKSLPLPQWLREKIS